MAAESLSPLSSDRTEEEVEEEAEADNDGSDEGAMVGIKQTAVTRAS